MTVIGILSGIALFFVIKKLIPALRGFAPKRGLRVALESLIIAWILICVIITLVLNVIEHHYDISWNVSYTAIVALACLLVIATALLLAALLSRLPRDPATRRVMFLSMLTAGLLIVLLKAASGWVAYLAWPWSLFWSWYFEYTPHERW